MPPRTAYSPTSRTVAVRSKPFVCSQRAKPSIGTTLPALAKRTRAATLSRSGTRWTIAFAVVKTTNCFGSGFEQRVERAHPLRGDFRVRRDPVVGKAVPGRERQRRNSRARRTRAPFPPAPAGGRRARRTATAPSLSARRPRTRPSRPSGTPPSVTLRPAAEKTGERIGRREAFSFCHGLWHRRRRSRQERGVANFSGDRSPRRRSRPNSSSSGYSISASKSARSWSLRLCYMGIGEAPEKQVHLAHAPMPGAEERPASAWIECARLTGHAARRK